MYNTVIAIDFLDFFSWSPSMGHPLCQAVDQIRSNDYYIRCPESATVLSTAVTGATVMKHMPLMSEVFSLLRSAQWRVEALELSLVKRMKRPRELYRLIITL